MRFLSPSTKLVLPTTGWQPVVWIDDPVIKKENKQCFMYRMKSEFINKEIWIHGYLLENEDGLIVLSDQLAEAYETNILEKRYVFLL